MQLNLREALVGGVIIGLVGAAMIGFARSPRASLLGDSFNVKYAIPTTTSIAFDAGVQKAPAIFDLFSPPLDTVTISANTITATTLTDGFFVSEPFVGPEIFDLTNSSIMSVTLDPSSTLLGFTQSDITFTNNSVFLNWQGLSKNAGDFVTVDVVTATAAIPEPPALALLATSIAALGLLRRRKINTH
jgi:hypothetical protein